MNIEYFVNNWRNINRDNISFTEDEWVKISYDEYLSEEFIEKFENEIDWYCISKYQTLSEDFIERYENKVDWINISLYQVLSEKFIYKNRNRISYCDNIQECLNERYAINGYIVNTIYRINLLLQWDYIRGFNTQNIQCSLLLVEIM